MNKQLIIGCEYFVPTKTKEKITKDYIFELDCEITNYHDYNSNVIPALHCTIDGFGFLLFFGDTIGFDFHNVIDLFDTYKTFELTENEYYYFKLKNE